MTTENGLEEFPDFPEFEGLDKVAEADAVEADAPPPVQRLHSLEEVLELGGDALISSSKQVLEAQDHSYAVVDVPEWAGAIAIRSLTASESDEVTFGILNPRTQKPDVARMKGMRVKLVLMGAIKPDGTQLFSFKRLKELSNKNSKPIERVATAVSYLSGIGKKAKEDEQNSVLMAEKKG